MGEREKVYIQGGDSLGKGKEAEKHTCLGWGGEGSSFQTEMGDCEKGGCSYDLDPIWNTSVDPEKKLSAP